MAGKGSSGPKGRKGGRGFAAPAMLSFTPDGLTDV